jgi:hypothetical protein
MRFSRGDVRDHIVSSKMITDLRSGATEHRSEIAGRRCRRAADETYELASLHSITSLAKASNVGGIERPSAFAVFMLITSSNLVACSTGKSAGLAPFSILSM